MLPEELRYNECWMTMATCRSVTLSFRVCVCVVRGVYQQRAPAGRLLSRWGWNAGSAAKAMQVTACILLFNTTQCVLMGAGGSSPPVIRLAFSVTQGYYSLVVT